MSPAERLKLAADAEADRKVPCSCGARGCGCKREATVYVPTLAAALREAEAERERAEKIAAAERALRKTTLRIARHDEGCGCDGCSEYGAGEEALAALGVEP